VSPSIFGTNWETRHERVAVRARPVRDGLLRGAACDMRLFVLNPLPKRHLAISESSSTKRTLVT
jgi:hypothetical protein